MMPGWVCDGDKASMQMNLLAQASHSRMCLIPKAAPLHDLGALVCTCHLHNKSTANLSSLPLEAKQC